MTPTQRDRLHQLLLRHDQALTVEEAKAAGFSAEELRRLVDRRELRRPRRGLLVSPSSTRSVHAQVAIAIRLAKRPAFAARHSALLVHGLRWAPGNPRRPEVLVAGSSRPELAEHVIVHRTRQLDELDLTTVQGIPTTTVERAVIDLASGSTTGTLLRLIDEVLYSGLADRDTLVLRSEALQRGRRGVRTILRVASARGSQRFRSDLERVALPLLRGAGLHDVVPNVVPRHAPSAGEMDAVSEHHRVIVELDGLRFHADGRARQRDNVKGNAVVLGRYTLLRFTYADIHDRPRDVEAQVHAVVGRPG